MSFRCESDQEGARTAVPDVRAPPSSALHRIRGCFFDFEATIIFVSPRAT